MRPGARARAHAINPVINKENIVSAIIYLAGCVTKHERGEKGRERRGARAVFRTGFLRAREISAGKPTAAESTVKCNNYHCYRPLLPS